MPSRVIHIRLDDWVLLGCHDVLQAGGKSTDNLPMSTVVREVLTAFIRKMQQGEHIPAYDVDALAERIAELSQGELETPEIDVEGLFDRGEEPEDDLSDLASRVIQNLEREGEPAGVQQDVEISAQAAAPRRRASFDIFKIPSRSYIDIRQDAPKDRLVERMEAMEKEKGVAVWRQALAITYSNLPQSQWGSAEAEDNIRSLVNMHLGGST